MNVNLDRIKRTLRDLEELRLSKKFSITQYKVMFNIDSIKVKEKVNDALWEDYETGNLWGGYDKHAFFKTEFILPESYIGKKVVYRVTTGQEGEWDAKNPQFLCYVNNEIKHGLDVNHREVILTDSSIENEHFEIALYAYSGLIEKKIKLFSEIYILNQSVEELYYNIKVPYEVALNLDENDYNRIFILENINKTINQIDFREVQSEDFTRSIDLANQFINENFYNKLSDYPSPIVSAIGHTHIDVAWLWTLSQTREKVIRSFSTVLNLMDQYPEYKFFSSQPQLYEFIMKDEPELFEKIKERVSEGRWEVEGSMWLEADCNLSSGESLIRQIMVGKKFFKDNFNKENRTLWLPDVFGYSAILPQILKRCNIEYFITSKISWNQFNRVPNDTFFWRGIDGTEILTYFITTQECKETSIRTTYNGLLNPSQIMGTWNRYGNKEISSNVLIPFGFGDGGGGPTKEMLENARRLEKGIPGSPKVKIEFLNEFLDKLKDNIDAYGVNKVPRWVGELYLEYHRGTYTSMARNKRYNRKSEYLYQTLELFSVIAMTLGLEYDVELINMGWKTILLNQFHDILPGSSIKQVYEESKEQYERILEEGHTKLNQVMTFISNKVAVDSETLLIFNSTSFKRDDVIELDLTDNLKGRVLRDSKGELQRVQLLGNNKMLVEVKDIPAKGYKGLSLQQETLLEKNHAQIEYCVTKTNLENKFFSISFDDNMNIVSIYDKIYQREIIKKNEKANVFTLFEDRPMDFDNWDIDLYYKMKSWELTEVKNIKIEEIGPIRYAISYEREFLSSHIKQIIYIYNNQPKIDFKTIIDWNENSLLLKVGFPVEINSSKATFDIQYGNIERDTHYNTSWDIAKFETWAHKWVDLSDGGYGVSLINDCKYGYDINDSKISLTLLKSGMYPNPEADREIHEIGYSLYPHKNNWRESELEKIAYSFNMPLYTLYSNKQEFIVEPNYTFVECDKDNVIIEVVKKAEDNEDIIIRLFENHNKSEQVKVIFNLSLEKAWECNLLEDIEKEIIVLNNEMIITIEPYEIKTLRVRPK